jgi:Ca-activated chloride channel family protein
MSSVKGWWVAVVLVAASIGGGPARAEQVKLDVSPSYDVLKAGAKQTAWIRVGVTGFAMRVESKRAPVNVALVLDKSGSMQGQKIAQARQAAIGALDRLGTDDIVSVVTYDSTVHVLVPATKLTDKEHVARLISQIEADGNTALFAGVSKGAAEVRKFASEERVNRIILLSDGLANVGPSAPGELGDLGESLRKESISVSTLGLGLGYNEDLMVKLAGRSGGNHQFVEEATELAGIFDREFDDVTSVVAQDVKVRIEVPEGIRPVRVLGNDAEINGQEVLIDLSQVYSEQNKHIVLEVEVPATEDGRQRVIASVAVSYKNMQSHSDDRLTGTATVTFSKSESKVEESLNKAVLEDVVVLISNEQNKLATDFLDKGDLLRCRQTLLTNEAFLNEHAVKLNSRRLQEYGAYNRFQADEVSSNENRARKGMRELQLQTDTQQKAAD